MQNGWKVRVFFTGRSVSISDSCDTPVSTFSFIRTLIRFLSEAFDIPRAYRYPAILHQPGS